jgi:hypothetical protein
MNAAPRVARDCGDQGPPIVELAFAGEHWDAALERGIVKHLRAGLEPAGFRVCVHLDGQNPPVATVELRQRAGESVMATIEVRDGVTAKRVARDIDLSALPEDGRALGVGLAADELLRASWAELALRDAPPPASPPPPAVEATVRTSLRVQPEPEKRSALVARGAVEGHAGGLFTYGGDVAFRHWFTTRFGAEIAAGVRGAPAEDATNGSISASGVGAGVTAFVDVVRADAWRLSLEGGVWGARLEFQGVPTSGAAGARGGEVGIAGRGGAGVTVALSSALSLALRAGLGVPLRAVSARDDGKDAVGTSGVEWYAGLGPQVAF